MNFCLTMSPDALRMRHGNIELVAAIYKKKAYDCGHKWINKPEFRPVPKECLTCGASS